jgi:hypothetical protein
VRQEFQLILIFNSICIIFKAPEVIGKFGVGDPRLGLWWGGLPWEKSAEGLLNTLLSCRLTVPGLV